MECQCAGCYPEREARRKHRESMARIDELRELRERLCRLEPGETKTFALEECDKLIQLARESLLGKR